MLSVLVLHMLIVVAIPLCHSCITAMAMSGQIYRTAREQSNLKKMRHMSLCRSNWLKWVCHLGFLVASFLVIYPTWQSSPVQSKCMWFPPCVNCRWIVCTHIGQCHLSLCCVIAWSYLCPKVFLYPAQKACAQGQRRDEEKQTCASESQAWIFIGSVLIEQCQGLGL